MTNIDTKIYGNTVDGPSLQLVNPKERIIATGLIPASAVPDERWREVELPSGVTYDLERLSDNDSMWNVWVTLPPDAWLIEKVTEEKRLAIAKMRARVRREVFGTR